MAPMKRFGRMILVIADIAALACLAVWGWHVADGMWRAVLAFAIPAAAAAVFWVFLSPKSQHQPRRPLVEVFHVGLLLLAAFAAYATGAVQLALPTLAFTFMGASMAHGLTRFGRPL